MAFVRSFEDPAMDPSVDELEVSLHFEMHKFEIREKNLTGTARWSSEDTRTCTLKVNVELTVICSSVRSQLVQKCSTLSTSSIYVYA